MTCRTHLRIGAAHPSIHVWLRASNIHQLHLCNTYLRSLSGEVLLWKMYEEGEKRWHNCQFSSPHGFFSEFAGNGFPFSVSIFREEDANRG